MTFPGDNEWFVEVRDAEPQQESLHAADAGGCTVGEVVLPALPACLLIQPVRRTFRSS